MKHLANGAIACALLMFTLPLMMFVALALKCESRGPVVERRQRLGPGGRRFDMLTFRTTEYDPENPMPSWARQPTALGSFLRYTRIDALPRLINAMHGELSSLKHMAGQICCGTEWRINARRKGRSDA